MKFLTPDLLTRFASTNDEVADDASEEWEQVHTAYRAHVAEIRFDLPRGARRLLKKYYLHDAKVLAITTDEAPYLSIFLELPSVEDPRDRGLELRYKLAGGLKNGFKVFKHDDLADGSKPLGWWLYDEFDVDRAGSVPVAKHSVLFTGGYELQLAFYELTCSRMTVLYRANDPDEEVARRVHELLQT